MKYHHLIADASQSSLAALASIDDGSPKLSMVTLACWEHHNVYGRGGGGVGRYII